MMQSEIRNDKNQKPEASMKSRVRLIQQNKRIVIEVYKLEQIISNLIEKDVSNDCEVDQQTESLNNKFKNEMNQQLKQIVKMKKEIKKIKSTFAEHKYEQIKKQENQVTFYKRQHQKLVSERDILYKRKNEKQEALVFHKPINSQTAETYEKYKKIKAQNGEIKLKIHQVERQVARYHKYKELSKTSVPKEYDNPDYQFMKIDNQIKNMRKQMKRIEEKWKAKIQSLDKQYFTLKNIFENKESEISLLERQSKNIENRMTSHRDQIMVSNDRQRVNSILISPQKRKEMRDLLQEQKKKLKRLEPKSMEFKSKFQKGKKENSKQVSPLGSEKVPVIEKVVQPTPVEQKEVIKPVKIAQIVKEETVIPKGKKMVESVGVGTSFYYSDD